MSPSAPLAPRLRPEEPVRRPVLIISHDVVGPRLAGPGLRYFHLARVLAGDGPVVLAVPEASPELETPPPFALLRYGPGDDPRLAVAVREARVVVVAAVGWAHVPALAEAGAPLVVDCYDPIVAEVLHAQPSAARAQQAALSRAYLAGDFFICASERQRDWLLGLLEAHGRINAATYQADPSLRRLVDVVPFGLPETPPRRAAAVIRGVWDGIGPEDRVLLWGGGLWPWLDPLTAIRAVAQLRATAPDVRLIFPGTRHPNPVMGAFPSHAPAARALAAELGLLDRHVFFGDWVPQAQWPGVLLESDLALTLHGSETLESRLAFRSRVLDYIWAGLPIVATRGDATSQLIESYRLGVVVEAGRPEAVAEAIAGLLAQPRGALDANFAQARAALTWELAAGPLRKFCAAPTPAADHAGAGDRPGNPLYVDEITRLRERVAVYERLWSVRLGRWLHSRWSRRAGR